ncbi:LysR family transcriptional regulator [Streptacidiphilus cavernicola]|uniref:LysR family transcriptional regulator n=1 Tax=Streptacidiphilus cavernicola TaxID=3342716 RepID=A0ABV6VZE2_9ACTN
MLNLSRLQALQAVATHGSITGASAALGYTPSAVSQQIAKLERETRTELLERQGGRIFLTPAAHVLVGAARDVLFTLEQAEARLEEQRATPAGRLLMAGFPTACHGLLPAVLAALAEHRELDSRLVEADPHHVLELVVAGEADLGVVHDWHNTPLVLPASLSRARIGVDVADVLLPAGHRLSALVVLSPADLADERWISQQPGSMCHDWLQRTFAEEGVEPRIGYSVGEYQSQMALLAAGLGVALVPRLGRGLVPEGVQVAALHPRPWRRIWAVWRTPMSDRPAVRAALAALTDQWAAQGSAEPSGGTGRLVS